MWCVRVFVRIVRRAVAWSGMVWCCVVWCDAMGCSVVRGWVTVGLDVLIPREKAAFRSGSWPEDECSRGLSAILNAWAHV